MLLLSPYSPTEHDQINAVPGRSMGRRDLRPAMTVARKVDLFEDWYKTGHAGTPKNLPFGNSTTRLGER